MLISKYVQIEFADPRIDAIDRIQDISRAAEHARLNLFSRYNIRLKQPMRFGNNKVFVEIQIPEELSESFSIGNHLRGLSAWLLKEQPNIYAAYRVGKRLLNYTEIASPVYPKTQQPVMDQQIWIALNLAPVGQGSSYEAALIRLRDRIATAKETDIDLLSTEKKMYPAFSVIQQEMQQHQEYLRREIGELKTEAVYGRPVIDSRTHLETIERYAESFHYHINGNCPSAFAEMLFSHDARTQYRLFLTLHYVGYNRRLLALGAFLTKRPVCETEMPHLSEKHLLKTGPLFFASASFTEQTTQAVRDYIETALTSTLDCIAVDDG